MKPALAELIGTFALTFIGAGSIIHGKGELLSIAFAHGLTVMVMVYVFGATSGTHINPAVTIGLALGRQITWMKAVVYLIAQFAGAIAAGYVLKGLWHDTSVATGFLGTPALNDAICGPLKGFLVETGLTFFLVLAVFGSAVDKRAPAAAAGLAIGLTVTIDILMGGPITGAAMNPARYFGTALASGHLENMWVYFAGPIVGAVLAWIAYTVVIKQPDGNS